MNTKKSFIQKVNDFSSVSDKVFRLKTLSINDNDFINALNELSIDMTFYRLCHPLQFQRKYNDDEKIAKEEEKKRIYSQEFIYNYNSYFYTLYNSFKRDLAILSFIDNNSDWQVGKYNCNGDYVAITTKDIDTMKRYDNAIRTCLSDACDVWQECKLYLIEFCVMLSEKFPNTEIDLNKRMLRIVKENHIKKSGEVYTITKKYHTSIISRVSSKLKDYCSKGTSPKIDICNFATWVDFNLGVYESFPVRLGIDNEEEARKVNAIVSELKLTKKEVEVLSYKIHGDTDYHTAKEMQVSVSSVRTWKARALKKAIKAGYYIDNFGHVTKGNIA